MSLPTKDEIVQAIEQSGALNIPQLAGYNSCPGLLGPESYSGGFCIVFPFTNGQEKKAVRVWHQEIENIKERYSLITKDIIKSNSPYLCNVDFVSGGLNVNGTLVDVVFMDWVEGVPLKKYIQDIINNGSDDSSKRLLIKQLANNLQTMFQDFHDRGFSHGDLQHDNIIVQDDGSLKVIDYDCFYTSSLGDKYEQTTSGYKGYQHPLRFKNKLISNEKIDYFSELIIYLSVLALSVNMNLWRFTEDADFNFLFSEDDFRDLENSSIYKEIAQLGRDYKELLDILGDYLKAKDLDELQPFSELQLQNKILFTSSVSKAVRNKQMVILSWSVPFEANVLFEQKGKGEENVDSKGKTSTVLSEDGLFLLTVEKPNGLTVQRQLVVNVFDECEIEFSADKYYIFPTIPVTLSWNVKNAKKVWLNKEEVEPVGTKVIEPTKAASVTIEAEDEFDVKEKRIDIGMLPIPQVKSLLVPTPDIVQNMSITIKQPRFNVDVKFPTIDNKWIKAEVPKVKSLKELGLFRELSSSQLPSSDFHILRTIKKVYNHLIKK